MFDPSSNDLKRAVRDLRAALGKTQTEFGALIGKGLATVQRYEGVVPPRGRVLVRLAALADDNSQTTLAALFRSALEEELGGLQTSLIANSLLQELLLARGLLIELGKDFPTLEQRVNQVDARLLSAMEKGRKLCVAAPPQAPEVSE